MDSIVIHHAQDIKQKLIMLIAQNRSFGLEHKIQIRMVFLDLRSAICEGVVGRWLLSFFPVNFI